MDKIEIGAVAKPQGIKGELKLKLFADDFSSLKNVKTVEIGKKLYAVENFKASGNEEAIIKLGGVDDRTSAETFRMLSVYASKSEIVVPSGKFFISDVIGAKVLLSSGKEIGKVTDIVKGNVDYYYIDTLEGKAVFPLVKRLKAEIDIEKKTVTVDAKAFTEVVLYED
ncbi:MAG: 16S rRNA processing protein RimM [Clostridia bacterium]|nr:16S rRNA processing protein RimM [Clostridia bacterium]